MKSKYAVIMTSLTLAIVLVSTPAIFAQIATPDGHSILFNPASQQIPPGGTITAIVGVQAPIAAVMSGANIIEVHITSDKKQNFIDNPVSFDYNELKNMVNQIRNYEKIKK